MNCKQCGADLSFNTICLYRNWPGREDAVKKAFPKNPIHMCPNAKQMTLEELAHEYLMPA